MVAPRQEPESSRKREKRKYVRLSVKNPKLKFAVRHEGLGASAKKIGLKDISIGGLGLTVPDARTVVSTGMVLEFAVLLPSQEICWLTGSVVYVGKDSCGVQFREDYEQRKLSRYILELERELRGYEKWEMETRGDNALNLLILESVWNDVPPPEDKKILFISAAGKRPAFIAEQYAVLQTAKLDNAETFSPDLVLVDADTLSPVSYRDPREIERHPAVMEASVFMSIASVREGIRFTVRTSAGGNTSFSVPKERFEKEAPNILNILLKKYQRTRTTKAASGQDRFI